MTKLYFFMSWWRGGPLTLKKYFSILDFNSFLNTWTKIKALLLRVFIIWRNRKLKFYILLLSITTLTNLEKPSIKKLHSLGIFPEVGNGRENHGWNIFSRAGIKTTWEELSSLMETFGSLVVTDSSNEMVLPIIVIKWTQRIETEINSD